MRAWIDINNKLEVALVFRGVNLAVDFEVDGFGGDFWGQFAAGCVVEGQRVGVGDACGGGADDDGVGDAVGCVGEEDVVLFEFWGEVEWEDFVAD